jgi:hypothetical protein
MLRAVVYRRALQGFGKRHLAGILMFAVLVPLVVSLFAVAMGETVRFPFLVYEFAVCLAIGASAQLSALAADNLLRHRIGTVGRLAIATVIAATAATALIQVIGFAVAGPLGLEQIMAREGKAFASTAQRVVFEFAGAARWSMMLVVICELVEANRRAQDELHSARMAALAAERDLVEGDLRTMQARVDPDLLFDSLLEIDRAYAHDTRAGQERLDALIRFLRAALPGDGNGSSSVLREQELAEAYVALHCPPGGRRLKLELSVDPATQHEPMPPMLLLPLVRWALADHAAQRLRINIQRQPAGLAVEVGSDARGNDAAALGEVASIRARLAQLYALGATLRVDAAAGERRAALTIPLPQTQATPLACAA